MYEYSRGDERRAPRLLNPSEAKRVIEEVKALSGQTGSLGITVLSWWSGGQRWARNRASMTSDQRDIVIRISRNIRGGSARVMTNQLDEASLKGAVDLVEWYANRWATNQADDMPLQVMNWNPRGAQVWSDETFNRGAEENGRAVQALTMRSESGGFLSAGYIESFGSNVLQYWRDVWGRDSQLTGRATQAQCSVTVRNPTATGSGWAGNSSFDIRRIDVTKISDLAFEKCLKSIDAVRIEPGRYQTIFEPPATATFAEILVGALTRSAPEMGIPGPFLLGADHSINRYRSKLGLKVVDPRISIHHDPTDPIVGTHAAPGVAPVNLIQNGILTTLYNDYVHALNELVDSHPSLYRSSFKFDGTDTTLDEMISSMERGLLVTRVSQPEILDSQSLLYTGLTRDGLWLIENGKITKAVRNFRWTESPLFMFNNIEEIGQAVPVFSPVNKRDMLAMAMQNVLKNIVVPSLKVNDFSFTSTIDAV